MAAGAALVVAQQLWSGGACAGDSGGARAGESDSPIASASPATCPAPDSVWAFVVDMVPRAASQVLAAKPRVSLFDLNEKYRVRIATDGGTVERTNTDPARDCDQRARFVAEFIVLTLLPPQLGPGDVSPEPPAPPNPPRAPPPPPLVEVSGEADPARIEVGVAVQEAPRVLGAPDLLSPGADARVRLGPGRFAAIVGAGYYPRASFQSGTVSGSLVRVPAVVGARARLVGGAIGLAADLALSVAFEGYAGTSPRLPREATRIAPGFEAGVIASARAPRAIALFIGLRCALFPVATDIGATPQGVVGKTPLLWFGGILGVAIGR